MARSLSVRRNYQILQTSSSKVSKASQGRTHTRRSTFTTVYIQVTRNTPSRTPTTTRTTLGWPAIRPCLKDTGRTSTGSDKSRGNKRVRRSRSTSTSALFPRTAPRSTQKADHSIALVFRLQNRRFDKCKSCFWKTHRWLLQQEGRQSWLSPRGRIQVASRRTFLHKWSTLPFSRKAQTTKCSHTHRAPFKEGRISPLSILQVF